MKKNVLLLSMPFAGLDIPSIQLGTLDAYLKEKNIHIETRHLYLKAAEIYGLNNYNYLIYPPNDSYTAQMVFSKYVFPNHWENNQERFREYYNKKNTMNTQNKKYFDFDEYVQLTDVFYNWFFENVDWQTYDILGFTLNYGQFLPSLAVAKKIKQIVSDKKIVFGGSRTVGDLGKKVLECFPYVDFMVSGDGEQALYRLAGDYQNYTSIPNLIYRKNNRVVWNQSENTMDLNTLPIPWYDSFYEQLDNVSLDIQQFFSYNGKLPVEISRGCWWNKCTFCNLNIQYSRYREKNVDKIVEEIDFLSDKYKVLNFQIISNNLLVKDHRLLCEKLVDLGKDFSFFAEARADNLKGEDYGLLKEAGFDTIQTGIESFSSGYLRKMNKGTRVIDNVAVLKFCRENRIRNNYNLIIDYPNEEVVDFEENQRNIQLFKQFLDPPQICYLRVLYGSPIYGNPEVFNIMQLEYAEIDKVMFPQVFLDKDFSFVYGFKRKKENMGENDWYRLVESWKKDRRIREIKAVESKNVLDKLVFYYVDGGSFLKIFDSRNPDNVVIYVLDKIERNIFLNCCEIVSYMNLKKRFSVLSEMELKKILDGFEEIGIVFKEDDCYLALPLNIGKVFGKQKPKKSMENDVLRLRVQ